MRKYLTREINTVLVEDLRESKFEALTLYYKSFAKLDYLLRNKSYTWLLLLLSWIKILAQKWKYLKILEPFSLPFSNSSLSLREIMAENINFIQLCEIEFRMENWIRNWQWSLAQKWHYVQIMILSSVYKHHI